MPLREIVWTRLASDLKPRHLDAIAYTIRLEDLPAQFEKTIKGQVRGRAVVALQ
jgi:alcohol dehydrogenase